jgi:glycosyltransferase involved in cell wall biosynthesis
MTFNGVSTILPVFCRRFTKNWCSEFRRAVESVLAQESSLPMELIIVDDGSTEPIRSQKELADLLDDRRISHIQLKRNNGLVFALNVGLNLARYPLIGRIDGDDAWRPGKLNKQLTMFMRDPELTIVGSGMRLVHESGLGNDHDLIRPGSWHGILKFAADIGCPFPHGSILARKDIFHLLGGYSHDPGTAHCEDFALWTIWLRFFKAAMVEEVLYDYTISAGAVSTVNAEQQRQASGCVHARYLKLPYERIPGAISSLSKKLGIAVLETGKACFAAWQFYNFILADPDLMEDLSVLLPDRQVLAASDVNKHLGDRFFYFSKNPLPGDVHARCIHGPSIVTRMM